MDRDTTHRAFTEPYQSLNRAVTDLQVAPPYTQLLKFLKKCFVHPSASTRVQMPVMPRFSEREKERERERERDRERRERERGD